MWGPHSPSITAKSILIKTQVREKRIKYSKKHRGKEKKERNGESYKEEKRDSRQRKEKKQKMAEWHKMVNKNS